MIHSSVHHTLALLVQPTVSKELGCFLNDAGDQNKMKVIGGPMTKDKATADQQNENLSAESADLVKQIKASAKEIWLAGLGAFSQKDKAQEDDNGRSLYQQLVKEGKDIERVSREQLDRNIQNVKSIAFDGVDQVKERAFGSFTRLEHAFDERVHKALSRLGLATQEDYATLERRLDQAEHQIADLEGVISELKAEQAKSTKSKSTSAKKDS